MNPDSYFENDPWSYAVENICSTSLGRIVTIAVQVTCVGDNLSDMVREWRSRLDKLLGQPAVCDILCGKSAVSILLQYKGSVIVRIFIDKSIGAPVCNFEIVGTKALLVWKPDIHALSNILTLDKQKTLYEHPYANALGKGTVL